MHYYYVKCRACRAYTAYREMAASQTVSHHKCTSNHQNPKSKNPANRNTELEFVTWLLQRFVSVVYFLLLRSPPSTLMLRWIIRRELFGLKHKDCCDLCGGLHDRDLHDDCSGHRPNEIATYIKQQLDSGDFTKQDVQAMYDKVVGFCPHWIEAMKIVLSDLAASK